MTGAQAEYRPDEGTGRRDRQDWLGSPPEEDVTADAFAEPEPSSAGARVLAGVLIVLGVAWMGVAIWSATRSIGGADLAAIVSTVAMASAPLILLGLVWLIFGRTSRRESERFQRAVATLKGESAALDSVLQIMTARLEESYARLGTETTRLMALGDEASDRLGRVTHYLAKETATLDSRATQLEAAANTARVDIGVLLTDLPKAEEQARAVAEAMKDASFTAHAETGQLESQLSALIARGREADEVVGGAAQRLAAHLARIQSSTITVAGQLDQAATSMSATVDDTMVRAAEAVDAARASMEAQGQAMLAMIEQSRAALEQAGEASGRNLSQRLEAVSGQIGSLAGHLAAQDSAAQTLVARLQEELAELEQRFALLGSAGGESSEQLSGAIHTVRDDVERLMDELDGGKARAEALIGRARELAEALQGVTGQIEGELSNAFTRVETQAGQARTAAENLAPMVEGLQVGALDAATQIAAAEASIARQQSALDALLAQMRGHVAEVEGQLRGLEEAAGGADAAAGRMVEQTGPELVEALVRVRETATQAAERAREAIAAIIPESASRLADASAEAMGKVVTAVTQRQLDELAALSERAAETARAASERLTRQMLGIGEAAAAVEARIDAARQAREAHDAESFSRRVAILIESLNSAAIDVAKILSNDVTDSAWAAYLKGDRGVFTRRAVRLLDNREARDIARLHETDLEFGEQVNRYIADFEAMLRRVMSEREGNALAVTILSSDMGKLYVALAQATERLRG